MGPGAGCGPSVPVTSAPRRVVEAGTAVMVLSAPISISGTQLGLAVALLGALWGWREAAPPPRTAIDAPLLAFIGVTVVSALASDAPGVAVPRIAAIWTALTLYLVAGWFRDAARLERFLLLLVAAALPFGAYGIVQHFTGVNLFGSGGAMHSLVLGERLIFFPRGGFSHYQTFANVYFVVFCLACGLAAAAEDRRDRALRAGAAVFLAVVVVFTFTRGIWIALLAALAILAWVFARRAATALAVAGALVVAALLVVPSSLRTRAVSMTDLGTNVERLLLWETAWNMVRDRPVLGVGIGNFRAAQDAYVREAVPLVMTRTHAHNVWLQVAVERGVLGVLALLWLFLALLGAARRAVGDRAARRRERALAAGALAAVVGLLLDGLVQNNFGDSQVAFCLWLVAGVIAVCARGGAQGEASPGAVAEAAA
ncbi:MAG TPA: O-antigen ligase family protein [bacterium]